MKKIFFIFGLLCHLVFSNMEATAVWHEFEKDQEIYIQALLAEGKKENKEQDAVEKVRTYKKIRLAISNKKLTVFDGIEFITQQNSQDPQREQIQVDAIQPLNHDDIEEITIEDGHIEIIFKKKGACSQYTKMTITRSEEHLPAKMIYPIHSCSVTLSEFWKVIKGIWNENGYHEYEEEWQEKKYHSIEKLILPSLPISIH